jgi:hypothetical protein
MIPASQRAAPQAACDAPMPSTDTAVMISCRASRPGSTVPGHGRRVPRPAQRAARVPRPSGSASTRHCGPASWLRPEALITCTPTWSAVRAAAAEVLLGEAQPEQVAGVVGQPQVGLKREPGRHDKIKDRLVVAPPWWRTRRTSSGPTSRTVRTTSAAGRAALPLWGGPRWSRCTRRARSLTRVSARTAGHRSTGLGGPIYGHDGVKNT